MYRVTTILRWKYPRRIRATPTRVFVSLTFTFAIDSPVISANVTVSMCSTVSNVSISTSHQVGLIMFQEVIGTWRITTNDYARCHRRKVKVPIVYVSYYDITLKMTTAINNLLRCIDFSHCRTLNALLRQLFGNICHITNV